MSNYVDYKRVPIKHYNAEERVRSLDMATLVPYTLEEVVAESSRCLGCGLCIQGCPARIDVPGYQIAMANGNVEDGLKINFEKLPFVEVCGNVCPHPCEDSCILDDNKGSLATRHIKKFISEDIPNYKEVLKVKIQDLGGHPSVAVIGAGPAGLTAAFYLSINGIKVDVFEATDKPGGVMVHGIPPFRLPREAIKKESEHILSYGAKIFYNTRVGKDIPFETLMRDYSAVYIAVGNWKPTRIKIKGEELSGVYHALEFLNRINSGEKIDVGESVAIIGGGFTAYDAARISLRLGAKKVTMLYRRSAIDRPGYPSSNADEELEEAEEEKVTFDWETSPFEYTGENGKVNGLKYWRNQMVDAGKGRRQPVPIKDKEYFLQADTIIEATGQREDLSFIPAEIMGKLTTTQSGDLQVNQYNMTSYPGIFAGGDITNKRKDIISGVADSGRASMGILLYLKEIGEIRKIPKRLTNYEGGPYSTTYYDMENKETVGLVSGTTEVKN
ncbi:MAG: FAD-dependent oxidoreductase [Candidatus Thermoplasmatota archaeon]|nr:FAD-dependent oxidoreductase [Candidatus Thermoplasmatota archaeon]